MDKYTVKGINGSIYFELIEEVIINLEIEKSFQCLKSPFNNMHLRICY